MNFPSEVVREMVASLGKKPTLQATEVYGLTPEQAAEKMKSLEGSVVINMTKVPTAESEIIHQAVALVPEGKVELISIAEEDAILRQIVIETFNQPVLFRAFLQNLWGESSAHFILEWDQFIVSHPVAGKAETTAETHHWANIGLQDADHPLRVKVRDLIANLPSDFWSALLSIIPGLKPHPFFKSDSDIVFALTLAMVSNFVRGVYYSLVNPSKVNGYFPRSVAVKTVQTF